MLQEGIAVNLPKTNTSQVVEQKEDNVVLTVVDDGNVYIGKNNDAVSLQQLGTVLKQMYTDRINKEIYLKGDKSANYGDVVSVMSEIQKIGGLRLGLITEQDGTKK